MKRALIRASTGAMILGALLSAVKGKADQPSARCMLGEIRTHGLKKTSSAWLVEYLGLTFPASAAAIDLAAIESKLLTTAVFRSAKATIHNHPDRPSDCYLDLDLEEKWTVMPVLRAVVGGGTPLGVLGAYDTHAMGSLWTLGSELRRYGNAPTGGVVWAKAPRWRQGDHAIGIELWQDNRERVIFKPNADAASWRFTSLATSLRAYYFAPLLGSLTLHPGAWQQGLDLKISRQDPIEAQPLLPEATPADLTRIQLDNARTTTARILASLVLDQIQINNMDNDGTRITLAMGPMADGKNTYSVVEAELFNYQLLRPDTE